MKMFDKWLARTVLCLLYQPYSKWMNSPCWFTENGYFKERERPLADANITANICNFQVIPYLDPERLKRRGKEETESIRNV